VKTGALGPTRLQLRSSLAIFLILSIASGEVAAPAQSISVTSITPGAPDIGRVVSAPKNDTVFRISPTGTVTIQKGSGVRLTSGNASTALVTIRCGGGPNATCPDTTVTVQAAGTPTGRGRTLSAFTIAAGPNPPTMSAPKGKNSITFTVSGALKSTNYDFYVGMDFPIAGDDSGAPSGTATSSFSVSVPGSAYSGTAVANVSRPIAVSEVSPLNFGTIIRPRSGTGSVVMDPSTGAVSVTGGGWVLSVPSPSRGAFLVTGEGGQAYSISVPPFQMKKGGNTISVTPSTMPSGTVYVGGSFPVSNTTSAGKYTGTVSITVQYN
jgi:hypothetical protein